MRTTIRFSLQPPKAEENKPRKREDCLARRRKR